MKIVLSFFIVLILASFSLAQTEAINIIPRPAKVEIIEGFFKIKKSTKISVEDAYGQAGADLLNKVLRDRYGFSLKIVKNLFQSKQDDVIVFRLLPHTISNDAYRLAVMPKFIWIDGDNFYALRSLFQLLPTGRTLDLRIRSVVIEDIPRFPYRGMHLDVSRHFFPVEFVKKYIDLMSQYKFNYFHWHLTDDQGWRIEIKKYPRLTEIGSKRKETVKERNLQPYIGDGIPVEGFYTQDQIKEVVAYAKARYITVIPEIEMPGHSSAALAAYPEFGCKQDYQYKVQTTWGIFKEVYCPTEATFKFLEDVISEVVDLFPDSPYIHIGGDEVLKDHWKESAYVQDLKTKENLKDEHEVQSYFIRRMEKFINSKGKKIIGWDEILEGGVAPNATIMSWRGEKGGIEAAKAKHDVIMTPNTYAYFDYGQGDPAYEPLNIGSYVPLEKVYGWDPVPKDLSADEKRFILGGQANVWTEYMKTPDKVEYMVFPRLLALSEVLWTQPINKDYNDFRRRLSAHFSRLYKQGVNFRIPEPAGLRNIVLGSENKATIDLKPSVDGAKIYYTIDGSTPDEKSALYDKPIQIEIKEGGRVDLKTITVLPSGAKSSVYAATILRRDYLPASELTEKRPGATYAFFIQGTDASLPPKLFSGETRAGGFQQFAKFADLKQPFSVSFDGYVNIPSDAIYEFQTDSIWDAAIYVDGEKLIDFAGTQDRAVNSAVVPLRSGYHRVSLRYGHRGGNAVFRVRFGVKGQGLSGLSAGELVH